VTHPFQSSVGTRARNAALRRLIASLARSLLRSYERYHHRRALANLSDARLRDIGLTREEVEHEIAKLSWWR